MKKVITYVKNCDTQPWKQGHICLVSFSPEHIFQEGVDEPKSAAMCLTN